MATATTNMFDLEVKVNHGSVNHAEPDTRRTILTCITCKSTCTCVCTSYCTISCF
ncbi:FDLD family class I lanthipeptide [Bacillus sp. RCC_6_1]|uniref:FDLD family class I lanthipeptide n=1 Tax=Bacillus sp. RCC_6_1 TaxID=3239229 RepID=UPI00352325BC